MQKRSTGACSDVRKFCCDFASFPQRLCLLNNMFDARKMRGAASIGSFVPALHTKHVRMNGALAPGQADNASLPDYEFLNS